MCATWADGEADKTCEGLVRSCYSTFSSAADVDGRCERTFEDVGSDDDGGGGSGGGDSAEAEGQRGEGGTQASAAADRGAGHLSELQPVRW